MRGCKARLSTSLAKSVLVQAPWRGEYQFNFISRFTGLNLLFSIFGYWLLGDFLIQIYFVESNKSPSCGTLTLFNKKVASVSALYPWEWIWDVCWGWDGEGTIHCHAGVSSCSITADAALGHSFHWLILKSICDYLNALSMGGSMILVILCRTRLPLGWFSHLLMRRPDNGAAAPWFAVVPL